MKRIYSTILTTLIALSSFAEGWPAQWEGVMLQGFYWDSYTDTKWTNLVQFLDIHIIPPN